MRCPYCHERIPDNSTYCPICDTVLEKKRHKSYETGYDILNGEVIKHSGGIHSTIEDTHESFMHDYSCKNPEHKKNSENKIKPFTTLNMVKTIIIHILLSGLHPMFLVCGAMICIKGMTQNNLPDDSEFSMSVVKGLSIIVKILYVITMLSMVAEYVNLLGIR